jgi:hypothetical protein
MAIEENRHADAETNRQIETDLKVLVKFYGTDVRRAIRYGSIDGLISEEERQLWLKYYEGMREQ